MIAKIRNRSLAKGLLTLIPGSAIVIPRLMTSGTSSAEYCYGVWTKHLAMLRQHGMMEVPETFAELGPGGSLGIGLCGLLSGSSHYCALDVTERANVEINLAVFQDLLGFFRARKKVPSNGWPEFWHYDSPLMEDVLSWSLSDERVEKIRRAIRGEEVDGVSIRYFVPWTDESVLQPGSVDALVSHSVMEHVADPEATYRAMRRWLKPGGWMSHQIDFTSHGVSREWNGYRAAPEWLWKLVLAKREFLINRTPFSEHRRLVNHGFEVICAMQKLRSDGIPREMLARRWRDLSDDDLNCASAFLQARRL